MPLVALGCDDDPAEAAVHDVGITASDVSTEPPDAAIDAATDAGPIPDASPEPAAPLDAPGPFGVGYREESLTYQSPLGERTLRIAVWYPTHDTDGFTARYASLIFRDDVWDHAAPALDGPAPLMLFSHGSQGIAEQSYFLTEFFASHGWVVVAPDHPGNTFIDNSGEMYEQFELRPRDLSEALDFVLGLPSTDPLADAVGDDILMVGHSFGGYTALAYGGATLPVDQIVEDCESFDLDGLCEYLETAAERIRPGFADPRVDAVISMTPVWARFFEGGLDEMGRPVLLMTGSRDTVLPNAEEGDRIWAWLAGPDDVRVDVTDAGHLSFSDFCTVLGGVSERIREAGCGEGFIEPARVHRIVKAWSIAFAARHVLGDERGAALLDGELQLDDAAVVSRR